MKRIAFALALGTLGVEIAIATTYPFFQQTIPGGVHEDGDAKWEDQAEQMTSIDCGKFSKPKQHRDLNDCLGASVRVKSHAKLVMECRMVMEHARPDDSGRTRIETSGLIGPGEERWGAHSFGPNGLHIVGFSSQCVTIPREPKSELDTPAHCSANVVVPQEDYPRGLLRQRLEGRTIIEYTAAANRLMEEMRIVGSSGSAWIDEAALKAASRMRVTTNCSGQRFRHTVTFTLPPAP